MCRVQFWQKQCSRRADTQISRAVAQSCEGREHQARLEEPRNAGAAASISFSIVRCNGIPQHPRARPVAQGLWQLQLRGWSRSSAWRRGCRNLFLLRAVDHRDGTVTTGAAVDGPVSASENSIIRNVNIVLLGTSLSSIQYQYLLYGTAAYASAGASVPE